MWYSGLRLIDPLTESVAPVAVEVLRGRIARIASSPNPGSQSEDLQGAYVMPGLISCHTHLQGVWPFHLRDMDEPVAAAQNRALQRAREIVEAGVTTIRCLHEKDAVDILLRDDPSKADSTPRILASGRALTAPHGHGDGLGAQVATGRTGFRAAATAELGRGADQVKVFASGGLARSEEAMDRAELSVSEMRGAVDAATEFGTYVVAHAAGSEAVMAGIEAGVRSFEHGYLLDDTAVRALAESGSFLTPTLVVTHATTWRGDVGFSEADNDRAAAIAPLHMKGARLAIEAGVSIVMGTDFSPASADRGVSLAVRELELLVEAGMTPGMAIRAATSNAAQLLGRSDIGRLDVGSFADFVAMDFNPLADIRALQSIWLVVKGGLVVRNDAPGSSVR